MSFNVSEWSYFENIKFTELNGLTRYFNKDQMVCFIHRATPLDVTRKDFVLEIYANKDGSSLDFYSDTQFYFDKIFKCVLKADSHLSEMGFKLKKPFIYNLELEDKI
tara:strand:+ start:307 stop:627 length:321 start_codon:yes stop_codon:yes gene_type:complete